MKDWNNYQEKTYNEEPHILLKNFKDFKNIKTVVDLGCGSGNETVYMLKKGLNVTSIDRQINKEFFTSRLNDAEMKNLDLIEESFETVKIPKCDLLMAFFSIPFCKPESFDKLWNDIYNSINPNGYFIGELFGNRDAWNNTLEINTFTKEEVLKYLEKYDILLFEEKEFTRESDNKKWHYFDIIAKKKH